MCQGSLRRLMGVALSKLLTVRFRQNYEILFCYTFFDDFQGFCSIGFNLQAVWTNLVLMKMKTNMKVHRKTTFNFTEKEIRALFRSFNEEIHKLVSNHLPTTKSTKSMIRLEYAALNLLRCSTFTPKAQ